MPDRKVAYFGPMFGVDGAGHLCSDVVKALGQGGFDVDLLVDGAYPSDNPLEERLGHTCSVNLLTGAIPKDRGHNLQYYGSLFWGLSAYLRDQEQVTLLSNGTKYNILSVWASAVTDARVHLILLEHRLLRPRITGARRVLPPLVRTHYPWANHVVGVSEDVTNELVSDYGLAENLCTTIPNPVDTDRIAAEAEKPVSHPWFSEETLLIVGVGRLIRLKQFSVLLQAFERVRRRIDARLVLIGRGPKRKALVQQADELGLQNHVDFLGFVDNPYKYMNRADLLAHPSQHEGFGLVLVEALACGTPVVATDCPGGPSDILAGGEYGKLVDVGSRRQLADAAVSMLADPPDPDQLIKRASDFDVGKIADRYENAISKLHLGEDDLGSHLECFIGKSCTSHSSSSERV
jgi:glycosyltransferase involved in cell wall biosynthesis